jgi:hypothetical protein
MGFNSGLKGLTHTHSFCTTLVQTAALNSPWETHRFLANAALQTQTIYNRTLKFFNTHLNIAVSVSLTSPVLHERRNALQFPARTSVVSLLQTVQTGSGPTQPPVQGVPNVLFRCKARGGEVADNSLPHITEFKKATSTHLTCLQDIQRVTSTLTHLRTCSQSRPFYSFRAI